ncbi:MAG: PQQ-binding-like beta-propeller repeat protein [Gammaproteobacteria bacterium]|nr:PQQ-binding-like beta-propeller repeat protein [Gammaproteobacteria bacterium]
MKHLCRITWVLGVALGLAGRAVVAADAVPVAASLPAPIGADWEGYNKTLDGQRYSLLDQINTTNAASLAEVCRVRVATRGSFQSGLVVVGNLLYATTSTETFAIDPVTCALRWQHSYQRAQAPGLQGNRGVAWLNGRVFRGTDDARLIALDALTGREIWVNVLGDPTIGEYLTGAPVAWNGLVIAGISGSEFGIRGRIIAFDALTGREVWRFNTVATGAEVGADTWGDRKWSEHGGGGTWSTMTIDQRTGELFVPVGNPVPDYAPQDRPVANLFTNSVLVLDAVSGALRWWYQLQANDDRDHDLAAAPVLFHDNRHRAMVAAAGKDGLLHLIDRETREARFKVPVTTVDAQRPAVTPEGIFVCPGAYGGVLWNGPAFDPKRMWFFTPAVDQCMVIKSEPGTSYVRRGINIGGSYSGEGVPMTGWITAVDANTGAVRWKYHADVSMTGGVTPTAGGVVLTGDNAGNFLVFASDSGKLLLKHNTGGAISGGVVTYARGGRQYVAVTSGNVSPAGFGTVGQPSVVVLALPETPAAPAAATAPDVARGEQLYGQICAGCHGADGGRITAHELKQTVARTDAAQLLQTIVNPAGAMPRIFPAQRTADDERDLRDIVTYLQQRLR